MRQSLEFVESGAEASGSPTGEGFNDAGGSAGGPAVAAEDVEAEGSGGPKMMERVISEASRMPSFGAGFGMEMPMKTSVEAEWVFERPRLRVRLTLDERGGGGGIVVIPGAAEAAVELGTVPAKAVFTAVTNAFMSIAGAGAVSRAIRVCKSCSMFGELVVGEASVVLKLEFMLWAMFLRWARSCASRYFVATPGCFAVIWAPDGQLHLNVYLLNPSAPFIELVVSDFHGNEQTKLASSKCILAMARATLEDERR